VQSRFFSSVSFVWTFSKLKIVKFRKWLRYYQKIYGWKYKIGQILIKIQSFSRWYQLYIHIQVFWYYYLHLLDKNWGISKCRYNYFGIMTFQSLEVKNPGFRQIYSSVSCLFSWLFHSFQWGYVLVLAHSQVHHKSIHSKG
jgi:hypothetical protein